jgi:hypothetical protein
MALLWCDGFDGYGDSDNTVPSPTGIYAAKYASVNLESAFRIRNSGFADLWHVQTSTYATQFKLQTPDLTTNATMIAGVSFYYYQGFDITVHEVWPLFRFANDSDDVCCEAVVQHKGGLYITDADGEYVGGVMCQIDDTLNQFVEMKVYSHISAGTIEVRVNGCPMYSGTGLKTATSNGTATRVGLGHNDPTTPAGFARLDNFYVCDGSGNMNNDFLGRITIKTLFPNEDYDVSWNATGCTANNYQNVNKQKALPSTNYVSSNQVGDYDWYEVEDLDSDYDTIHGVVGWALSKWSGNTANYAIFIDSANTYDYSANFDPGTTIGMDHAVWELDVNTNTAWTPSTVNAVRCGIETMGAP